MNIFNSSRTRPLLQAALTALLFATCARGFGADKFKFSESLRDKLICDHGDFVRICYVGEVESFHVTAKFAWPDPSSATNIDAMTVCQLSIGDLSLYFTPSDDPRWVPGKRVVTIPFTYENDHGHIVHDGKAVLHWNTRGFTLSVSSPRERSVGPRLVDGFRESDRGEIATAAGFDLEFGDFHLAQTIDLNGRHTRRRVKLSNASAFLHALTLHGTFTPGSASGLR